MLYRQDPKDCGCGRSQPELGPERQLLVGLG
ncbi:hypothetical protein OOU_Y34scaffold00503g2 [Pyricularia oryzae Y34]|uniref:Uncharacterized protein n=1 Tax=Pyricularia oryzae (strain Y34) TaxID=1143189 RepID=A0AA97PLS8_PYRO3|nr:hypothetical protein OOU_Y34scaffold00503g2 [Pyricularia oryzae Y34]